MGQRESTLAKHHVTRARNGFLQGRNNLMGMIHLISHCSGPFVEVPPKYVNTGDQNQGSSEGGYIQPSCANQVGLVLHSPTPLIVSEMRAGGQENCGKCGCGVERDGGS